jgi:hypothetical protein
MFESTSFEVVFFKWWNWPSFVGSDISFVLVLHNGRPFALLAC